MPFNFDKFEEKWKKRSVAYNWDLFAEDALSLEGMKILYKELKELKLDEDAEEVKAEFVRVSKLSEDAKLALENKEKMYIDLRNEREALEEEEDPDYQAELEEEEKNEDNEIDL
jgi:hypothetical protein